MRMLGMVVFGWAAVMVGGGAWLIAHTTMSGAEEGGGVHAQVPSDVVRLGVGPWESDAAGLKAPRDAGMAVRDAAASLLTGSQPYAGDDVVECTLACPADSCGFRGMEETVAFRHTFEALGNRARASEGGGKTYLFVVGPPHHGTTAVYGLLSTSPMASTLAGHGNWAGEGTWLLRRDAKETLGGYVRRRWDPAVELDVGEMRRVYERYWNMSRPVLVEKSPPSMMRLKELKAEFKTQVGGGGEPPRVKFIFVVRSPCAMRHSETTLRHHKAEADGVDAARDAPLSAVDVGYAARYYVTQMHNLVVHGLDGILVRHEDLLMDPDRVAARILSFVPELRTLDPTRVDDAFAESMQSREGQDRLKGVASFAQEHAGGCVALKAPCLPPMYAPVLDFFYHTPRIAQTVPPR